MESAGGTSEAGAGAASAEPAAAAPDPAQIVRTNQWAALLVLCVGTIMPASAAQLRLLQVRAALVRTSVVAQSAQRTGEDPAS